MDNDRQTTGHACECCGEPAMFLTVDGVWLCEGDAAHLIEHDRLERGRMDHEQYPHPPSYRSTSRHRRNRLA